MDIDSIISPHRIKYGCVHICITTFKRNETKRNGMNGEWRDFVMLHYERTHPVENEILHDIWNLHSPSLLPLSSCPAYNWPIRPCPNVRYAFFTFVLVFGWPTQRIQLRIEFSKCKRWYFVIHASWIAHFSAINPLNCFPYARYQRKELPSEEI